MNIKLASSDPSYLKNLMLAKKDGSDKENEQGSNGGDKGQNSGNENNSGNGNGKANDNSSNNGKDTEPANGNNNNPDKENGKGSDNGKNNSNGNGNGNEKNKDKSNGNSDKSKEKDNNGKDKNDKENGNGWAKGKDKDKAKGDRVKHLGWYKNGKADNGNDPHNPGGDKLVNPEIFQVTNYINDLSAENEEVLMTSDVDGNYRGVYTYDDNYDLIGVEDLGNIEGKPNDPLYYLKDALGSITSITNMNGEIIDSNRFAPYGEPLDPVAKNARLTNSPYGYTGESHDIEGDLVYLRARYYEPGTMRFLQQDTMLGNVKEPLTRNLYIYGNANPLKFVDPSGHMNREDAGFYPDDDYTEDSRVKEAQGYLEKLWFNLCNSGVNDIWSDDTSSAVAKFQTYDGLNSTGELDERTFVELMTMAYSTPYVENYYSIFVGEYSGFVQYTQENLNTLADSGKISTYAGFPDGIWAWYNSQTADSVRDYQESNGYTVTGAIDTYTYSNLITDRMLITDPQPESLIIPSTDWVGNVNGTDRSILSKSDYAVMLALDKEYARYETLGDNSGMDAVKRAEASIWGKNGDYKDNYSYKSDKINTVIEAQVIEITDKNVYAHNGVREATVLYLSGLVPGQVGQVITVGSFVVSDDFSWQNVSLTAGSLYPFAKYSFRINISFATASFGRMLEKPPLDVKSGDVNVMLVSTTDKGNKITVTQNYIRDGEINYSSKPETTEIHGQYRAKVAAAWKYD